QDQPPASRYVPSRRSLPARLPPLEYPGHMEIRRVSAVGQLWWRGRPLHLTEVLAGPPVALEEVDAGDWLLYFGAIRLARFDERTRTLIGVGSCARLKTRVWKLPELWTQRTRPQAPWKTHKTRFPQLPHASTKCHPCLRTNLSPMCPAVRT